MGDPDAVRHAVRPDGLRTGLSLEATQERLRRRRFELSGLNAAHATGFINGLPPGRGASRPGRLALQSGGGWKVGVALAVVVLLLIPFSQVVLPSEGVADAERRVNSDPGPAATTPPAWPPQWNLLVTDPDTGMSSKVVDVVEVRTYGSGFDAYVYVRIVTGTRAIRETGGLQLAGHSWWVYLDFGDGNNDWIVEERPIGVCSHIWDGANADWGVGAGCDVFDTLTDADVGSAVRVVPCYSGVDCVDFAVEKSDYPGLDWELILTAAADRAEDLDLAGDRSRNPRSASPGCDPVYFDDCTPPARISLQIPEFPSLLAIVAGVPAVLAVMRRRTAARARQGPRP